MDFVATFVSETLNAGTQEFTLYTKCYIKYETDKASKMADDVIFQIKSEDTQNSGWKILSVDEIVLNVTSITQ